MYWKAAVRSPLCFLQAEQTVYTMSTHAQIYVCTIGMVWQQFIFTFLFSEANILVLQSKKHRLLGGNRELHRNSGSVAGVLEIFLDSIQLGRCSRTGMFLPTTSRF